MISTSSVTHATPACFYAHAISRGMQEDIAADMLETDIDFVAGGGIHFFNKRDDERNLLNDLEEKGFGYRHYCLGFNVRSWRNI